MMQLTMTYLRPVHDGKKCKTEVESRTASRRSEACLDVRATVFCCRHVIVVGLDPATTEGSTSSGEHGFVPPSSSSSLPGAQMPSMSSLAHSFTVRSLPHDAIHLESAVTSAASTVPS